MATCFSWWGSLKDWPIIGDLLLYGTSKSAPYKCNDECKTPNETPKPTMDEPEWLLTHRLANQRVSGMNIPRMGPSFRSLPIPST